MTKKNSIFPRLALALLLFISTGMKGQEMLGLAFSNYSGINPLQINPGFMTGSRVFIDFNVVSINSSLSNDIIYFNKGNRTIRKLINFDTANFSNGEFNWGRTYTYYNNSKNKYITASLKVLGPSLMIQNARHAFGLTTSFRSFHSANELPYEIPVFFYEGLSFEQMQNIEFDDYNFSLVSMSWSEVGLSYAYDFYDLYSSRLTFGVSLKALFGYEGGYIAMKNVKYVVHDKTTVDFRNLDAEIGYALPVSYGEEVEANYSPLVKGLGVGVDLGIVYTKLKSIYHYEGEDRLCAKPYNDYIFKVGFSILDLGGINFDKHAQKHNFDNVSVYWENFDTTHFRGIDYSTKIYSEAFYGDPDASYSGDKIKIGLPTALSLQFDYHFKRNYYFSALWIHPLRLNLNTLWRTPQLSIIPRYENRYLGVSLPLSLYNYNEPRIGLAIRLYYVTIGTDRLGSWLGVSKWSGMDIYFSLRFNIRKGKCASYGKGACSNSDFGNKW